MGKLGVSMINENLFRLIGPQVCKMCTACCANSIMGGIVKISGWHLSKKLREKTFDIFSVQKDGAVHWSTLDNGLVILKMWS